MIKPGQYLHIYKRKIICPHCPCKANSVCNGKGFYWGSWSNALLAIPQRFDMRRKFQIIDHFYARSLHELIEEIFRTK
jgi:hypothetical protein